MCVMLQHQTSDFYDLSSPAGVGGRHTPPYSPTGTIIVSSAVHINNNNNNNNTTSNNNNNNNNGTNSVVDVMGQQNGNSGRETLPSFGFTQDQVACVCDVSIDDNLLLLKSETFNEIKIISISV